MVIIGSCTISLHFLVAIYQYWLKLSQARHYFEMDVISSKTMNEDHRVKLIVNQARKISLSNWEISFLVEISLSKGCVDKILALLYEYAGCIDKIQLLMLKRSNFNNYFKNAIDFQQSLAGETLPFILKNLAHKNAQLIYVICCFRRLQSTPQPIQIQKINENEHDKDLTPQNSSCVTITNILKAESQKLYSLVHSSTNALIGLPLTPEEWIMLLSPACDFAFIVNFINSLFSMSQSSSVTLVKEIFVCINLLISLEDRIEKSWESTLLTCMSTESPCNLHNNPARYATLRLPYEGYSPPDFLSWFDEDVDLYKDIAIKIKKLANSFKQSLKDTEIKLNSSSIENIVKPFARFEFQEIVLKPYSTYNTTYDQVRIPPSVSSLGGTSPMMTITDFDLDIRVEGPNRDEGGHGDGYISIATPNNIVLKDEVSHSVLKVEEEAVEAKNRLLSLANTLSNNNISCTQESKPNSHVLQVLTDSIESEIPSFKTSLKGPALNHTSTNDHHTHEAEIEFPKINSPNIVTNKKSYPEGVIPSQSPRLTLAINSISDVQRSNDILQPKESIENFVPAEYVLPVVKSPRPHPLPALALTVTLESQKRQNMANVPLSLTTPIEDTSHISNIVSLNPRSKSQSNSPLPLTVHTPVPALVIEDMISETVIPIPNNLQCPVVIDDVTIDEEQLYPTQSTIENNELILLLDPRDEEFMPEVVIVEPMMNIEINDNDIDITIEMSPSNESPLTSPLRSPGITHTEEVDKSKIDEKPTDITYAVDPSDPYASSTKNNTSKNVSTSSNIEKRLKLERLQNSNQATETAYDISTPMPIFGHNKVSRRVTHDVATSTNFDPSQTALSNAKRSQSAREFSTRDRDRERDRDRDRTNSSSTSTTCSSSSSEFGSSSLYPLERIDSEGFIPSEEAEDHSAPQILRGETNVLSYSTDEEISPPTRKVSFDSSSWNGNANFYASSPVDDVTTRLSRSKRRVSNVSHNEIITETVPPHGHAIQGSALISNIIEDMQNNNDVLNILASLLRPARSRASSSVFPTSSISEMLRELNFREDATLEDVAAKKITSWIRMVLPQRKLTRRMGILRDMKELVEIVIAKASHKSIQNAFARNRILRDGAATRIQRVIRSWLDSLDGRNTSEQGQGLVRDRNHSRRRLAVNSLDYWASTVLVAILIHRFISKFRFKKQIKTKYKSGSNNNYARVRNYNLKLRRLMSKFYILIHKRNETRTVNVNDRRKDLRKTFRRAPPLVLLASAIIIQKNVRKFLSRMLLKEKRSLLLLRKYLVRFISKIQVLKTRRRLRIRTAAAITLQKNVRGMIYRAHILRQIKAAMRLKRVWTKHRASKNLRESLRRVERPYAIMLNGLENFPIAYNVKSLRVRVSVWWNPLLHIVSNLDLKSILSTKLPQYVYTSAARDVTVCKQRPASPPLDSSSANTEPFPPPPTLRSMLAINATSENQDYSSSEDNALALVSPSNAKATTKSSFMRRHFKNAIDFAESLTSLTFGLEDFEDSAQGVFDYVTRPLRLFKDSNDTNNTKEVNIKCDFGDEIVKIPGCHGNSVVLFTFLDGERKLASCSLSMRKQGKMMFWGGEYSSPVTLTARHKKRSSIVIQNSKFHTSKSKSVAALNIYDINPPLMSFRITGGPPSFSRCQWGKILSSGNGSYHRLIQRRNLLSAFPENWLRFFISLDEDGLHFYESKNSKQSVHTVSISDFKAIKVELGTSTSKTLGNGNTTTEDSHDIIVSTNAKDVIHLRFQDSLARFMWTDSLNTCCLIQKQHELSSFRDTHSDGGVMAHMQSMFS